VVTSYLVTYGTLRNDRQSQRHLQPVRNIAANPANGMAASQGQLYQQIGQQALLWAVVDVFRPRNERVESM
jgi:hypothetical protein